MSPGLGLGLCLGLTRNKGGGGFTPDPDTAAIFALMGSTPPEYMARAMDTLNVTLRDEGILAKLDYFQMHAAHTEQACCTDWTGKGHTGSFANSPVFTAGEGVAGDGVSGFYDTGYNPATAAGLFTQNSAVFGVWSRSPGPRGSSWFGWFDGTKGIVLQPRSLTDGFAARINQSTQLISGTVNEDGSGLFAVNRSASNAMQIYKNGTSAGSATTASATMVDHTLLIGRTATATYQTAQAMASFAGQSLTSGEHLTLYQALAAYEAAVCPLVQFAKFKRFGFTYSGTDLHRGGLVLNDGRLVTNRRSNSIFTIIAADGLTATQNHMGQSGQTLNLSGGEVGANGYGYMLPRDSAFIGVIDPATLTMTQETFGLTLTGLNKWTDGIVGNDGKIYGAPSIATDVLIIDTNTTPATATRSNLGLTWTIPGGLDSEDAMQWIGGVKAPDGRIFFCPYNAPNFMIIDTTAGTAVFENFGLTFGGGTGQNMWTGGSVGPDGKLYFIPRSSSYVCVVDPVAMTAELKNYGLNLVGAFKWARSNVVGGKVYGIPDTESSLLEIDTVAQTARRIAIDGLREQGSNHYIYGINHTDGKVWCPPRHGTHFMTFPV